MKDSIKEFISKVEKMNPNEPEFMQAITEVAEVIIPFIEQNKEYQGKKLGSYLLKHIIQDAFRRDVERIWVHTCSLDHKHALDNYLSRGLKIFRKEEIDFIP